MDERTSSDRQPRLSTPDILLSQDTLDPGERSTSRPSKPSRSTQNASDHVRQRPLSMTTPSSDQGGVNMASATTTATEIDCNVPLPEVFQHINTALSQQLLTFLGVQQISRLCTGMRLQLADGQQSNAFSVSGSYMDWKCFQEYVVECIKKNCHTAAYEVAFGKHTPEGRASTVVAAGHMSAEFEGSDDARLLSSKVDGSFGTQSSQVIPVSGSKFMAAGSEFMAAAPSTLLPSSEPADEVVIFHDAETVLDGSVVLYLGILQLGQLCEKLQLKFFADRDLDSVRVFGCYKSVNDMHQYITNVLRDNSGGRDFARVFGARKVIGSSCSRSPPGLTIDANDSTVAASQAASVEESASHAVGRETDSEIKRDPRTTDRTLKGTETETSVSDRHSISSRPTVSEQFQLNKTTLDVVELVARNRLKSIESDFHVRIRKDPSPSTPKTEVMLSVESTSENGNISLALQKLQDICLDISRQGVKEVQIKLAADEVALLKTMRVEEMRVAWTVNDDTCSLYGLQRDLDAAQAKVNKALEHLKTSAPVDKGGTFILSGGQKVIVKKGNIIHEKVDVIVNAANDGLEHGGGVAAAICEAAGGHSFQEESRRLVRQRGFIREGQVVYTGSGYLPFKVIVHAVPPRWFPSDSQYTKGNKFDLLKSVCYNSILMTDKNGGRSVAIPGLGLGIFGVPKEVCAQALLNGTEEYFLKNKTSPIGLVVFVDLDDTSVAAFMAEAKKRYRSAPGGEPPPVRRVVKPKAEGILTQVVKAGRSLVPWLGSGDGNSAKAEEVASDDQCPICFERYASKRLRCDHRFCETCIDQWAKTKKTCPICSQPFGKVTGNQPLIGSMTTHVTREVLQGYPECGTIVITYRIPSGVQSTEHPNPGVRYHGVIRTAYLPDNKDGKDLVHLLRKAFDARLVFTVGKSVTTGADNVVTWNDIHHKTNKYGGATNYGYPDSTYLTRLREDLKVKGIE